MAKEIDETREATRKLYDVTYLAGAGELTRMRSLPIFCGFPCGSAGSFGERKVTELMDECLLINDPVAFPALSLLSRLALRTDGGSAAKETLDL